MIVTPCKTDPITLGANLFDILDRYIPPLKERSIVVITSKIVSICEGCVVRNDGSVNKEHIIKKGAEWYIDDPATSRYHVTLTIKDGILIANSGIDESNGNGYFILRCKDPYGSAASAWSYLRKKYSVKHLGVIISDSRLTPLRWGTLGVAISYCGFEPLKNYIGTPDIFGQHLRMTKGSIIDGLAAAAVLTMGEGNEQTPLAVITEIPFVTFQDKPPTQEEQSTLIIEPKDDIYSPLINSPKWTKGNHE